MAFKYDDLNKEQLIQLLQKRDRAKKLGLVWERDDIEADRAVDADFVACSIDPTLSDLAAPWRNLIIEGDNFDALRWLRMTFAGRVKCIYIDPPYNTGSKDWVYNDHYFDANDRFRYSTWLEFLYRRLILARDLPPIRPTVSPRRQFAQPRIRVSNRFDPAGGIECSCRRNQGGPPFYRTHHRSA